MNEYANDHKERKEKYRIVKECQGENKRHMREREVHSKTKTNPVS